MYVFNPNQTVLPYGFDPFPKREEVTAARRPAGGHDGGAQGRRSGVIRCSLDALRWLLVADPAASIPEGETGPAGSTEATALRHVRHNGELVLPGSSLKGMVRSVHEALTPSCVRVSTRKRTDGGGRKAGDTSFLVRDDLAPCSDREAACPSCRVFGMMGDGSLHRGSVRFGTGRLAPEMVRLAGETGESIERPEAGDIPEQWSPRPLVGPIYGPPARGRKFYFHQHQERESEGGAALWVRPLLPPVYGEDGGVEVPGARFLFDVLFDALDDEELSSLVAALALDDDLAYAPSEDGHLSGFLGLPDGGAKLRHKLGYGKSAGMGSVHVRVLEVALDSADRLTSFDAEPDVLAGPELEAWVRTRARPHFVGEDGTARTDLVDIFQWPPHDRDEYLFEHARY